MSSFADSHHRVPIVIIAVLMQAEVGMPIPELYGEHGISAGTFDKWRRVRRHRASIVWRMKELKKTADRR